MLGALTGFVVGEMVNLRRSVRQGVRRFATRTAIWCCTLATLLAGVGCFVVAAHLALRLVVSPIGAWLITGGALLILGLVALAAMQATARQQRD